MYGSFLAGIQITTCSESRGFVPLPVTQPNQIKSSPRGRHNNLFDQIPIYSDQIVNVFKLS